MYISLSVHRMCSILLILSSVSMSACSDPSSKLKSDSAPVAPLEITAASLNDTTWSDGCRVAIRKYKGDGADVNDPENLFVLYTRIVVTFRNVTESSFEITERPIEFSLKEDCSDAKATLSELTIPAWVDPKDLQDINNNESTVSFSGGTLSADKKSMDLRGPFPSEVVQSVQLTVDGEFLILDMNFFHEDTKEKYAARSKFVRWAGQK